MNVLIMILTGRIWQFKKAAFNSEQISCHSERQRRILRFFAALNMTLILIASCNFVSSQTLDLADKRLDKSIPFSVSGARLADVIDILSSKTGIQLQAGIDENDWFVYDRKVVINTPAMKVRDIMQNIADTMRFSWEIVNNEGKNAYILYQSDSQKSEENNSRANNVLLSTRKIRDTREKLLQEMARLVNTSAQDLQALKLSQPWKYVLATDPLGANMVDFLDKLPEAKESFISGSMITTKVSSLNANQKESAKKLVESYYNLMKSIGNSEDHSELLSKFDDFVIVVNSFPAKEDDGVMAKSIIGRITLGIRGDVIEVPFFDLSSPLSTALGNAIVALKSGVSKSAVQEKLQEAMKSVYVPAKLVELNQTYKSDKFLSSKIKLFPKNTSTVMPNVLKTFSELTKLSVFGEYYPSDFTSFTSREQTVAEVLDMISTTFDLDSIRKGNMMVFQDKKYFEKRSFEIPTIWINYWTGKGQSSNGLLLADILQIAALRDEQIDNTIVRNADLMKMGAGEAVTNRYILRMLNQLNDELVKQIWEGTLKTSSLDEYQWKLLLIALGQIDSSFSKLEKGPQILKIEEKDSSSIDYTISFIQENNQPPVEFKFTTRVIYGAGG